MNNSSLIERDKKKLADNIAESQRQAGNAGLRLGVFERLRELERQRRKIVGRLIRRDPDREAEYSQHLF